MRDTPPASSSPSPHGQAGSEITFVPAADPSVHAGESSTFATRAPFSAPSTTDLPAPEPLPCTMIGRYVVERVLGEGAFGTVLLARDDELERRVAIKVPRCDRFVSSQQAAAFIDEARTVARLRHHGIVAVFDVGRTADQSPFVVLEYIDGPSLPAELDAGPLPPRRAAQLLAAIADAVAFAHKQGFVHRDLKPANILLDAQGSPHVADFGLALHESQQAQRKGEYAGTVAYMSPEQIRGEAHHLDGRTDIWALGVILYRMLTHRLPFAGTTLQTIIDEIEHRDPKPPRQIDETIPVELERIINRCCQKKVADRYSTASDLAADLRIWLSQGTSDKSPSRTLGRGQTKPDVEENTQDVIRVSDSGANQTTSTPSIHATSRSKLRQFAGPIAALLLFGLSYPFWPKGIPSLPNTPKIETKVNFTPSPTDENRVKSFQISHFEKVNAQSALARGVLGQQSFGAYVGDQVTLDVQLSHPAYAYLVAFRPDGVLELISPETEGEVPPLSDRIRYPASGNLDKRYGLQEGAGLWVFAVAASDQPLPAFSTWADSKPSVWGLTPAKAGAVLNHDGSWIDSITPNGATRAKDESALGTAGPFWKALQYLKRKSHATFAAGQAIAVENPP